ncbi:MAG: hypothetical protein GXX10_00105 [Clostridiaceae bacterium]|nr:hypothetical protein [Clostridiaceae bacterium]
MNFYRSSQKLCLYGAAMLFLMVCTTFFLFSHGVYAEEQLVYDYAGLLKEDEIENLESIAQEIGSQYNTTIYIITDNNSKGLSRKRYLEDFADSKEVTNSVIIFVNMEPGNRGVEIQGYGQDEFRMNNSRIEFVLDEVVPHLSNGDYYTAFTTFLEKTRYYLGKDPSEDKVIRTPNPNYAGSDKNYQKELRRNNIFYNIWFQLLVSLGIGGIVAGVLVHNSGGKVTVNDRTYLDSQNSRVVDHWDRYIRTTTTKVRNSSSSSGSSSSSRSGGSGVSSGGRSHSGGGRSF